MIDRILSWFGIYWYIFELENTTKKVYGRYLEEARDQMGYKGFACSLLETNDRCVI